MDEKVGRRSRMLTAWLETDYEKASVGVLEALQAARGHLPTAAKALAISERTMDTIVATYPDLGRVAKTQREAAAALHAAKGGT